MIQQLFSGFRDRVMQSPRTFLWISAGLGVSLFALGIIIGVWVAPEIPQLTEYRTASRSQYSFISPLLQCESTLGTQDQDIVRLRQRISSLHAQLESTAEISSLSVRYVNLLSGSWFEINAEENYAPASLVKLPVLMAYLKMSETDPTVLDRTYLVPEDVDGVYEQNISPENKIEPGQNYTVRDLLRYMIVYSDNAADQVLRENMTDDALFEVFGLVGIDASDTRPLFSVENFVSVREYTALLRILYNATYLNNDNSEFALDLLAQSTFLDGLRADIPPSIPIAHKFAERRYLDTGELQLHDCGIVYLPDSPYVLCVMSKGTDFSAMSQAIQKLSMKTYQGHDN